MRLLVACLVLFLAPVGALLIADRYVAGLEAEFYQDAQLQVKHLDDIYALYPPRAKRLRITPIVLMLKNLHGGNQVAVEVCSASTSVFDRLFDHLSARCGKWSLFRRARWSALLAVFVTAIVFGLVLTARIVVERYASLEMWPGNWTMWFVMRGLTVLLAAQVVASLTGYGIVLRTVTGKMWLTLAILAVPFAMLLLLERKLVFAFVEPRRLRVFRPTAVPLPVEGGAIDPKAAASSPAVRPGAERGMQRRRRRGL